MRKLSRAAPPHCRVVRRNERCSCVSGLVDATSPRSSRYMVIMCLSQYEKGTSCCPVGPSCTEFSPRACCNALFHASSSLRWSASIVCRPLVWDSLVLPRLERSCPPTTSMLKRGDSVDTRLSDGSRASSSDTSRTAWGMISSSNSVWEVMMLSHSHIFPAMVSITRGLPRMAPIKVERAKARSGERPVSGSTSMYSSLFSRQRLLLLVKSAAASSGASGGTLTRRAWATRESSLTAVMTMVSRSSRRTSCATRSERRLSKWRNHSSTPSRRRRTLLLPRCCLARSANVSRLEAAPTEAWSEPSTHRPMRAPRVASSALSSSSSRWRSRKRMRSKRYRSRAYAQALRATWVFPIPRGPTTKTTRERKKASYTPCTCLALPTRCSTTASHWLSGCGRVSSKSEPPSSCGKMAVSWSPSPTSLNLSASCANWSATTFAWARSKLWRTVSPLSRWR
mmetsp:Transcript_14974/g.50681  ORF Transcript_14974/g.50681 Transcript_14974/m.50681 type:complete len:453 (+) Transcript_14974:474-1832(+)